MNIKTLNRCWLHRSQIFVVEWNLHRITHTKYVSQRTFIRPTFGYMIRVINMEIRIDVGSIGAKCL